MTQPHALPTAHVPTEVTEVGDSLLITVSGRDRPGVTRALFATLSRHPLLVLDVEQVVIRGQLILGVLVAGSAGRADGAVELAAVTSDVQREMDRLGMSVTCSPGRGPTGAGASELRGRLHVTLLGAPLRPDAVTVIATNIADAGGNIDRIDRLAAYPVTAIELVVSGADRDRLRDELPVAAAAHGVDVAVQAAGLDRRSKRLVVMDVDSTLIQGEVVEMLADIAGCREQVAEITAAAMRGEIDFEESLRRRVGLLAGLDASALEQVRSSVALAPGARTLVRTLKRLGFRVAIVSGGFTAVTDHLRAELGIDFSLANTLEVVDGRLTGGIVGPVVDRAEKARALERFAAESGVPLAQTVAVGDGANDLDMLARAGLGVAFNAKPAVRAAADAAVNVPYLDAVLYLLGITREEVEAADAGDLASGR